MFSPTSLRTLIMPLAAVALFAACGGDSHVEVALDGDAKSEKSGDVAVQVSADTKEVTPVGENDVKITSTDNALILAVIADSVVIQLSDSLRKSVADSVKRGTADKGGIGEMIGAAVGAAVNTAMGFKVRVPARSVENLRYENGELLFNVKGKNVNINSDSKSDGSSTSGRFSERDAKRFIDAVKDAQARGTMQ